MRSYGGCVSVTQSGQMRWPKAVWALPLTLLAAGAASAEDFRIYTEHPRLFLRPQRLRLLKREKERQSLRWEQFETLMAGKARMSEPGFALALYFQVTGERQAGLEAVRWALGPGQDLRQLALVFDWCQPVLEAEQSRALAARLERGLKQSSGSKDVAGVRARVLAAAALAGHIPKLPEAALETTLREWWKGEALPALRSGRSAIPRDQHYALFELMHALRDNLEVDLAEDARAYFKQLPLYQLMSYYPAAYPAAENEYRIPAGGGAQVDLNRAALSRATELAMLAYEPNTTEYQYLQGWAMHDRFLLRSAFGITYEFLWANPYHPGLSYYNLPLALHDEEFGRLFVRSSWGDDARWAGYSEGRLETFQQGEPRTTPLKPGAKPLPVGDTVVLVGADPLRYEAVGKVAAVYVVGLKPLGRYDVEVDNEEMREERADRGGILALKFPAGLRGSVRMREFVGPIEGSAAPPQGGPLVQSAPQ